MAFVKWGALKRKKTCNTLMSHKCEENFEWTDWNVGDVL